MKARLRRAQRDAQRLGHGRHGQPFVVVEDEDGSLIDAQPTKAAFELVAIGDQPGRVAAGGWRRPAELDLDRPAPALTGRIDAGVDGQSLEPGIEPVRIAQDRQVPPSPDESLLDRVLRKGTVAEDEAGHGFQPRNGRAGKHGEGVMIAPARTLDEFPLVHGHLSSRPSGRVHPTGVGHRKTIPKFEPTAWRRRAAEPLRQNTPQKLTLEIAKRTLVRVHGRPWDKE